MIITYRNPLILSKLLDVHFDIYQNEFTSRWKEELKKFT